MTDRFCVSQKEREEVVGGDKSLERLITEKAQIKKMKVTERSLNSPTEVFIHVSGVLGFLTLTELALRELMSQLDVASVKDSEYNTWASVLWIRGRSISQVRSLYFTAKYHDPEHN